MQTMHNKYCASAIAESPLDRITKEKKSMKPQWDEITNHKKVFLLEHFRRYVHWECGIEYTYKFEPSLSKIQFRSSIRTE